MIPVLYEKDEKQFRTYGLGELTDYVSPPEVTRVRNVDYQLYMQYKLDGKLAEKLTEGLKIKSDAGRRTAWQTFEITRVKRESGKFIEVWANHISFRTMKDAIKPNIRVRNGTAGDALRIWNNALVGDDDWEVWSDITTTASADWQLDRFETARQVLGGVQGSILDIWGGEYEFDNKTIRLHRSMGRKAPILLEYGRNITKVEQDKQETNVYTSVYPFARYLPDSGETPQIVTMDGYFVDGKYVDMYDHRKILLVDFSDEFEAEEVPTSEKLRNLATQYVERNETGAPHENIHVEYVDLANTLDYEEFEVMEEVELNDTLPIRYPDFDIINQNAKVVAITYLPTKNENKSIELGMVGQRLGQALNGGVDGRIERIEAEQRQQSQYILNKQGNRIWYTTPPTDMEHKVGDMWFEENGPYTLMHIWNGSQWIETLNTEDLESNKRAIEALQPEVEAARANADKAVAEIDAAIANAGFTSLDETITQIQTSALDALTDARNSINTANEAVATAQSAIGLANDLSGQVSDFELTVNGFTQTVNDYEGQVSQFRNDVNGLNSTVASYETQLDAYGRELGTYATQVATFSNTVAGLDSTVSRYQDDVQGYQAQVATLNNTVSGFNSTVTRVESQYSELNRTVSSHTSSIENLDGRVALAATKTEAQGYAADAVDGLEVGGRNYYSDDIALTPLEVTGFRRNEGDSVNGFQVTGTSGNYGSVRLNDVLDGKGHWTVSFEFRGTQNASVGFAMNIAGVDSKYVRTTNDNTWSRVEFTANVTNDNRYVLFERIAWAYFRIRNIKVERGTKATGFSLAPEQTQAQIASVSSQLTVEAEKIESLITRVSGAETLVNSVKQTAESNTATIGDHTGRISSSEQNINVLRTTVADKADRAELTVLANGISSTVANAIDALEIVGINYFSSSQFVKNASYHYEMSEKGHLIIKGVDGTSVSDYWYIATLEPVTDYVMSFTEPMNDRFELRNANNDRAGYRKWKWSADKKILYITTGGDTQKIVGKFYPVQQNYPLAVAVKIEKGTKATDWTPAPEDMATESRVSQLADNINARIVEKGQVVAQINLEAGRTLIQSDKLVLDAQTTVFTGSAFIPSAAIQSLTADKVTTGTLNAANVNIINLNANSIATGTISGANSSWNLNTGIHRTNSPKNANIRTELADGRLLLVSNEAGDTRRVELDGQGLTYTTHSRVGRLRFNGDNFVLDNNLGLFGNHINSVNWLRLIGNSDYEMAIHKHPTASGGAIVDSSMVTLGLGVRDNFQSIAQFYGQIDFRRNLHMFGNDVREVNRVALHNSNTHFLSHHANPGSVIVDSTRFTVGIGSINTGFNDRIIVTNSEVDILAHLDMNNLRIDQVARLQLAETSGYFMHLSSGAAVVDSRMVTIAMGTPASVDRIANFYGRIDFFKNLNMNGNAINNQSDERLKTGIHNTDLDSLSTLKSWQFVNFEWIEENKPSGKQFGLIAQNTSEISVYDTIDDIWSVDSSKQLMMTSHAVQQLANQVDDNVIRLENNIVEIASYTQQALSETAALKQRVDELEKELKNLKGAA